MITNSAKSKPEALKGFDFGTSFNVAVALEPKFAEHLHQAGIYGCAYGREPVQELATTIPSISLIGTNADALRAAFVEFHEWSAKSDHDAVEITIIFMDKGGYLLGITPEFHRWQARTIAGDPLLDPLMMMLSWVKPIDSVNPLLLDIKDYYEAIVAPIAFTARLSTSTNNLNPFGLTPIAGIKPLIKFIWTFTTEKTATNSTSKMLLKLHKHSKRASKKNNIRRGTIPPPPATSKKQRATKRRHVLDQIFPVTCAKLARSSLLREVQGHVKKVKIRRLANSTGRCEPCLVQGNDLLATLCGRTKRTARRPNFTSCPTPLGNFEL